MFGREEVQLILGFGKDFAHQLPEPAVKFAAGRAARLGKHKTALVDVTAQAAACIGAKVEGVAT